MAGQKFLSLRDSKNNVIHPGFRYKHLRAALRKALDLVMEEGKDVSILDMSRGFLLCYVAKKGRYNIEIIPHYPQTVKRLWSL